MTARNRARTPTHATRIPTTMLAATLFALLLLAGGCGNSGPVDGGAAFAHVQHLVTAIGPRPFGSESLGKATDYFAGQLRALGLEPKRHEVLDPTENKLIRNLYVQIDGQDPQQGPILMLGAHYDTKLTDGHAAADHNFRFVGAIDGGGAPAVLLELARAILQRPERPRPNIWLYWIDAEESIDFDWNDSRALLGSKAFVRWLGEQKILPRVKAFVLLDLIGDHDLKIDRDSQSNEKLQLIFEQIAARLGVTDRVYKYKSGATDDHTVFRDNGIPAVLLIDFEFRVPYKLRKNDDPSRRHPDDERYTKWWHTPQDDLDQVSPASLAFAGNLVMAALPDLEAFVMKGR